MDTAKAGTQGYIFASWVKVNGVLLDSVGVKYKGNSSYSSTAAKNPIHINLKKYKQQTYQGLTDIKLANCYQDPSMIREPLSYALLKNYMDCSRSNFAQLIINDTLVGLFNNDEDVSNVFLKNHFFSYNSITNTLVKCSHENPSGITRCNLKYLSSDSNSYMSLYDLQSKYGWNDLVNLCDTVTNNSSALDNFLDMDRVIWMLAFDNLLVNLDSYEGYFVQNYYLYKDNHGRFDPIMWDLNMSLGGFPFAGNQSGGMGSLTVANMQNFPLNYHNNDTDWPLIKIVMNDPTYKRMYVAHMRTIASEMFSANLYQTLALHMMAIIDTAVQSDFNKTFTYAQFQNSLTSNTNVSSYVVPGIVGLMSARVNYLQSTTEFTATTPTISNITKNIIGSLGTVTATISNANTNAVFLGYRFDTTNRFRRYIMYDDGNHGDGSSGDGVYGLQFNMDSSYVQFYIYAENNNAGIFSPQRAEHEFYWLGSPNAIHDIYNQVQPAFSFFPNPCNNEILVNRNSNLESKLSISNVLGQIVFMKIITETITTINTQDITPGIYFLSLDGFTKKIVVNHFQQ
jgi:hypothetical protein